eukprot:gene23649-29890_t
MCVLASRKQTCINHDLKDRIEQNKTKKSLDESCREERMSTCAYGRPNKLQPLVRAMAKMTVWDIEDAVMLGNQLRGCPYYGSRAIFEQHAEYVLAPYNYIIDAGIRDSLQIDLKDAVVIFDEAHNIEDVCREAGSAELSQSQLEACKGQLAKLSKTGSVPHKALLDLLDKLLGWMADMARADESSANNGNSFTTPGKNNAACSSNGWTPAVGRGGTKSGWQAAMDAADIWEGPELLDIFDDRLGINEASLAIYKTHFEAITSQEEDMEGILDTLNMNDNSSSNNNNNRSDSDNSGDDEDGERPTQRNSNKNRKKVELAYEDDEDTNTSAKRGGDQGSDYEQSDSGGKGTQKKKSAAKTPEKDKLSGGSFAVLKGFLTALDYMLRNNRTHAPDYRVVLNRVSAPDYSRRGRPGATKMETMLNFWCMSASVVFKEIDAQCHSVLLTSGTLSPLDSFASELGASFPVRVEASHVINVATQLFVGVVNTCNDVLLKGDYTNQTSTNYQDAIGASLTAISRVTPGGVLVFVSSYTMLNRLRDRWESTGLLAQIEASTGARTFFEPRDSAAMNAMLVSYYGMLDEPRGKAILVAVCRGKVSEGINFSDHYARAVLIVGIPFPSTVDLKVQTKKKYQSMKALTDPLFCNGDEWYKQQAFRAVNQAIGRCIRHKNDYGAIFLLDPRFQGEAVMSNMSRWMRSTAVNYQRLEDVILPAKTFFARLLPADSEHLLTYADFKVRSAALAAEKEAQRVREEETLEEDPVMSAHDKLVRGSKGKKSSIVSAAAEGKAMGKRTRKNSAKESSAEVVDLTSSGPGKGVGGRITEAFQRMASSSSSAAAPDKDRMHSAFLASSQIVDTFEPINPLLVTARPNSPIVGNDTQEQEVSTLTDSIWSAVLSPERLSGLTELVRSWDVTGSVSTLPPSLVALERSLRSSASTLSELSGSQSSEDAHLMDVEQPPSASSSRATAPLIHTVSLPTDSRSAAAVVGGASDDLRFSRCGLFRVQEKWCSADGVVYRMLFLNLTQRVDTALLIAVEVIGTNAAQSHLMGSCFALRALAALSPIHILTTNRMHVDTPLIAIKPEPGSVSPSGLPSAMTLYVQRAFAGAGSDEEARRVTIQLEDLLRRVSGSVSGLAGHRWDLEPPMTLLSGGSNSSSSGLGVSMLTPTPKKGGRKSYLASDSGG